MGSKSDTRKRLADYIYNDLDREGMVEIEKEIAENPELSEMYKRNMEVKDYLKAKLQLEDMRSDPNLEEAERLAEQILIKDSVGQYAVGNRRAIIPGLRRRKMWIISTIAASITIMITIGISRLVTDVDRLYQQYYTPFAASDIIQRGSLNSLYPEISRGIRHYMAGRYRESILELIPLVEDPGIRAEVRFFTGISYMGLGQFQHAEDMFKNVLNESSRYRPETLWYLSLSSMKNGEIDKALELLGDLESYDGMYQIDAQDLARKLRRIK